MRYLLDYVCDRELQHVDKREAVHQKRTHFAPDAPGCQYKRLEVAVQLALPPRGYKMPALPALISYDLLAPESTLDDSKVGGKSEISSGNRCIPERAVLLNDLSSLL